MSWKINIDEESFIESSILMKSINKEFHENFHMIANTLAMLEGLQSLPSGHYMQVPSNSVSESEELVWDMHMKVWLQTEMLHIKNKGHSLVGKH